MKEISTNYRPRNDTLNFSSKILHVIFSNFHSKQNFAMKQSSII